MTDIRFACNKCGQPLETEEAMAGSTISCPKCMEPLVIPASSQPQQTVPPPPAPKAIGTADNNVPPIVETRIKHPNLFWRRIAGFLVNLLLLHFLIYIINVAIPSQLTAIILAWLAFGALWYSTNLRYGRCLGECLVGIRIMLARSTGEQSPRLLGRFALLWLPIFILVLPAVDPAVAASALANKVYGGVQVAILVWFLAMTISMAGTGGRSGLHDIICSSSVDFLTPRFLSIPRRIIAALGSLAVVIKIILVSLLPRQADPTLTATQSYDNLTYNRNREYAPQDIQQFYQGRIFEVQTSWQQPGGFLWLETVWKGGDGTGLLFVNNKKFGLICSNWHVVSPSAWISGAYHVRLRRNAQEEYVEGTVLAKAKYDIDLALIMIELGDGWDEAVVPPAAINELQRGEQAVAIGNALGEGISITDGLISTIEGARGAQIIRTSAPISPGNSGGPLFIRRGALFAGIITAQNAETRSQNINYAIPAEYLYNSSNWDFFVDDTKEIVSLLDGGLN